MASMHRALLAAAVLATSAYPGPVWPQTHAPPIEIAGRLAGVHPAEYYRRAAALFKQGRRDDAVFIFYLGQLRYRTHLIARKATLKPDGDPALFASLSEVVGRTVNEYAFGDIATLAATLDAVLAYDQSSPDTFTSATEFPAAHASVRKGLADMRTGIIADAEQIRAARQKNGLSNRGK